jgi:uncharacterized protein (UPF0548 family)
VFLIQRPDEPQLRRFLDRAAGMPLTYPVGLAQQPVPPAGFRVGEAHVSLGHGEAVFRRAVEGLRRWRQFDLGWVRAYPDTTPLEPGANVLVVASHFGFWSVHCCRIVYPLGRLPEPGTVPAGGDSPRLEVQSPVAGFAYGTLTEHAEAGEEIFKVVCDPKSGEVTYHIRAVSREQAILARLGFPVSRAFQARFRRDSMAAMRRYVDAAPKREIRGAAAAG